MSRLKEVEYEVYVEPVTLDHYRLGWAPSEGFHHAGVVTPEVFEYLDNRFKLVRRH
jgi:hypothetical protein